MCFISCISASESPILSPFCQLLLAILSSLIKNKQTKNSTRSVLPPHLCFSLSLFSFSLTNFSKWYPFSLPLWPHLSDNIPPALLWLPPHHFFRRALLKLHNVTKPKEQLLNELTYPLSCDQVSQPNPTHRSSSLSPTNHTCFIQFLQF